jgi:hypothetical protein
MRRRPLENVEAVAHLAPLLARACEARAALDQHENGLAPARRPRRALARSEAMEREADVAPAGALGRHVVDEAREACGADEEGHGPPLSSGSRGWKSKKNT